MNSPTTQHRVSEQMTTITTELENADTTIRRICSAVSRMVPFDIMYEARDSTRVGLESLVFEASVGTKWSSKEAIPDLIELVILEAINYDCVSQDVRDKACTDTALVTDIRGLSDIMDRLSNETY